MVIVFDIGNTNVGIAGIEAEQVVFTGKVPTNWEWDADVYEAQLRPVLAGKEGCGSILSSVVPQITQAVALAAGKLLGKETVIVSRETPTGLTIPLPEPDKIGRDRLVDAVWAAEHMSLPCVTADLGTATTLNVILPGKVFAGGVICAGIMTGLQALAQRAAQLPKLSLEIPQSVIGRDTRECMLSGAVAGTAGMVDGLVRDIEEELGQSVSLVITGGGAQYVSPMVRHDHVFDPDVTLKGLALLYEMQER